MGTILEDGELSIEQLEPSPFASNAYVVLWQSTGDSILVDAPAKPELLLKRLEATKPRYILLTHTHSDHIGALRVLRRSLNIPTAVHILEAGFSEPAPELLLEHGDILHVGKAEIKVLHTPGHTTGSACFLIGRYLLAGDTIFPGGPGRTSTPESFQQIVDSIQREILALPEQTILLPGHGNSCTVKQAREEFAVFASRHHDPNLCGSVLWLS